MALAPKEAFEPSLRKLPSRTPSETARVEERSAVVTPKDAASEGDLPVHSAGKLTRDLVEPATEDRSNFRFSAGREFTEKFERLAQVLGIESPHNHLEDIFDQALEIALEKKDPQRKLERRREREAKVESPRPGDAEQGGKSPMTSSISWPSARRTISRLPGSTMARIPSSDRCRTA